MASASHNVGSEPGTARNLTFSALLASFAHQVFLAEAAMSRGQAEDAGVIKIHEHRAGIGVSTQLQSPPKP
jgi:hypothetical protein